MLETLTVNLTEQSTAARQSAAEATGDNETDVVNRALQVYAEIVRLQAQDKDLKFMTLAGDGTLSEFAIG